MLWLDALLLALALPPAVWAIRAANDMGEGDFIESALSIALSIILGWIAAALVLLAVR